MAENFDFLPPIVIAAMIIVSILSIINSIRENERKNKIQKSCISELKKLDDSRIKDMIFKLDLELNFSKQKLLQILIEECDARQCVEAENKRNN